MSHDESCPFCLENNLFKSPVLAENAAAYLVDNHFNPGTFLIIPRQHTEALIDLPADWWASFQDLFAHILSLGDSYNISLNYGPDSGQSLKHLHFWIIPRHSGTPSSGKGLARLIDECDQLPHPS